MNKGGRTEKISVTLPRELAGEVRALVRQGEVSSFFTEALEHYLVYRKQKAALEKGFGAWKIESHPELGTPENTAAYVRSIRSADKERAKHLRGISAT